MRAKICMVSSNMKAHIQTIDMPQINSFIGTLSHTMVNLSDAPLHIGVYNSSYWNSFRALFRICWTKHLFFLS